jgi:uncharacterized membrane protein
MKNAIYRLLAKGFAPYKIVYSPINLFDAKQVIYAWSEREAIEWVSCAFNSDFVLITNRYAMDKIIATRSRVGA